MDINPELLAQNEQFVRGVVELAPGIHTATGYGVSNVHMIEGPESILIIDTTEGIAAAEAVRADLRAITDKPVETIVYTHSHRDHISGASVFADGGTPEIIASHRFSSDLVATEDRKVGPDKALLARTRLQFGMGLSFPDERVNLGIGPGDRPMGGLGQGYMPPTLRVETDRLTLTRVGRQIELIHAPGETPDHLVVWLPEERILFPGDNFYHAFPNLYPIRGSRYRDFDAWAESLDTLLALDAEVLGTGHTRPVFGAESIRERLTAYRDAIRHVISATSEALNSGATYDQAVGRVKLPPELAAKPYLREFYGRLAWAVRAYCTGTLGWYDGNPTNLDKLPPRDEATRWARLAGGVEALRDDATAALAEGDPQWSLELCDRLLALDPQDGDARLLKAQALRRKAGPEINATARNTYLLSARDLEEKSPK